MTLELARDLGLGSAIALFEAQAKAGLVFHESSDNDHAKRIVITAQLFENYLLGKID
jgi:hypothetical protein